MILKSFVKLVDIAVQLKQRDNIVWQYDIILWQYCNII